MTPVTAAVQQQKPLATRKSLAGSLKKAAAAAASGAAKQKPAASSKWSGSSPRPNGTAAAGAGGQTSAKPPQPAAAASTDAAASNDGAGTAPGSINASFVPDSAAKPLGGSADSLKVNKGFLSLEASSQRRNSQSRRLSTISQMSHMSTSEFSNSANGGLQDHTDGEDSLIVRKRFHSNDNYIQEQLPVLPVPAAVCVLVCNIVLPGLGTVLAGLLFVCFGAKDSKKGQSYFAPVCVNFWVGMSQLLTVTFLLVGWFWSIAWGVYAVQKALDYRDEAVRKRKQEIAERALHALMATADQDGGGGGGGIFSLLRPAAQKR